MTDDGRKIYSLWDAYPLADLVTYPSTVEGFGNAFLECVLARKPIFVNNYKPVYWPDIGSKGFETVMTEEGELTDDHIAKVHEIITNEDKRREITDHNFELGKEYFSYEVLENLLGELVNSI